jgi:group I intron endonuclease
MKVEIFHNFTAIYQIQNIVNNKCYIGSSVNFYRRMNAHYNKLIKNKHCNKKLQNAWNKYEKKNFVINILEIIEFPTNLVKSEKRNLIMQKEQYWVNLLKPNYNIAEVRGSSFGSNHTKETKDLLSKLKKGKKWSKERLEKYQVKPKKHKSRSILDESVILKIKEFLLTPTKERQVNREDFCKSLNIKLSTLKEIQRGTMYNHITLFPNKRLRRK